MSRPHCQHPDACPAARPDSHCRRCSAIRMSADPAIREKQRAKLAEFHADPATKAMLAERVNASMRKSLATPEGREKRRQHGLRQYREHLSQPDVVARNTAPETRARAGAKASAKWLAWCPADRRAEYRNLIRSKRYSAAEARAVIEATIPGSPVWLERQRHDARRAIEDITRGMRERAAKQRAQAY